MDRRPNPPGWVPPKAPYNPYDPNDLRPAEGYPSEFNTPGRPRNWSQIPKEAQQPRQFKEALKRLNYTPRPASELYPGQFKVLRRKKGSYFNQGVRLLGKTLTVIVVIGSVFFYRWNDGYDNIFSEPYRLQLRVRQALFGDLSKQQQDDMEGKQRGMIKKIPMQSQRAAPTAEIDSARAFERPERSHVIEAERRQQAQQEAILRAVKIAENKLETDPSSGGTGSKRGWFKWW